LQLDPNDAIGKSIDANLKDKGF